MPPQEFFFPLEIYLFFCVFGTIFTMVCCPWVSSSQCATVAPRACLQAFLVRNLAFASASTACAIHSNEAAGSNLCHTLSEQMGVA